MNPPREARGRLADPRKGIGKLTDELPLLLFPLRLETRFKRVEARGRVDTRRGIDRPRRVSHELWVRVFPDSCLVDTFEPEPSLVEIESVRRFWQAVWRSRDEGGERAAWRNLVASHGVGRSRWLVEQHAPLNPGDRPPPPPADTPLLAIPGEDGYSAAEGDTLVQLWERVWREGADGAAEAGALQDLIAALGDEDRARLLWRVTRPLGLLDPPPPGVARADATVVALLISFPDAAGARSRSWSRPPLVHLLPERLVCIVDTAGGSVEQLGEPIPTPLHVGIDPSGAPKLRPLDGGDLELPDELRWTVDFERAIDDGLGFKIPLSADQWLAGADRVTVLGVRLGDTPKESRARLQELLAHHRDGRSGLALVAQGTPTNNTEQDAAGFTRTQDADAAFEELSAAGDLGDLGGAAPPPLERRDGRWLADGLGIDPSLLNTVPGAHGVDQIEARAMNVALWPATLGYFAETMMAPLMGEETVEQLRAFFTGHVSGRGPLPAIRIGQQPYGILPAIAFGRTHRRELRPSRARLRDLHGREAFLTRLLGVLHVVDDDWEKLAAQVTALGTPGQDVEAALLEVLGLHPASAELHYRYAESLDHLFNLAGLFGFFEALLLAIVRAGLDEPALELLQRLGADGRRPAIVDRYFLGRHGRLLGDVIDDRPLSEREPVRVWTDGGDNYLRWLEQAARDSLETLRRQDGFIEERPPSALLYLLLRHALILGYADAGVQMHRRAGVPDAQIAALRTEPPFVHVDDSPAESESRWAPLLRQDAAITGDPGLSVAEAIAKAIGGAPETEHLTEQIDALRQLADTPTARLERLLAEHVDTCGYRFDAWRTGWLNTRLEQMREQRPDGVHLGAYGWLLDVRPSQAKREPVELPDDLAAIFQRKRDLPLESDSANGGYIHAPSGDQAVTAAVLRAGYLSNASAGNPEPLAVNLSSERVRLALATLEGMRNGQRLGALLGYRFERGLHDGHPGLELDRFILPMRKAFPLVGDLIADTRTDDATGAELIAARNVVDGLRLVEQVESDPSLATYPFGRASVLPNDATTDEQAAIEAEVERLRNVNDAVGDLLLAESVHQAAQGRYDASAAALDAVSVGGHPPEPEVVRTPRPGVALTHRLALQLDPDALAARGATPRAAAEPRIDRWLESVLPDLASVGVHVSWSDPRAAADRQPAPVTVTLAELGLRPVDLLAVVHADGGQQMAELDDRVVRRVLASAAVPIDVLPEIAYLDAVGRAVRVFDVAAPVRRLRSLVGRARPLRGADALLANEATQAADDDVARDPAPVAAALRGMQTLARDLAAQVGVLDGLARGPSAALGPAIDRAIDDTAALFDRAALHGVPQTGWGFAYAQRREIAAGLLARVARRAQTWAAKRADFDLLTAEYRGLDPATSSHGTRLSMLRRAEISVSASVITPEPADLDDLLRALDARATAFDARRRALAAIVARPPATLSGLLRAVGRLLPLSDVDLEPFDLLEELGRDEAPGVEAVRGSAGRLADDLLAAAGVVSAEVQRRATAAAAAVRAHGEAATGLARVEALTRAAQAIFGEEFVLVPDTGVPPAHAAEVATALAAVRSGELTRHLTTRLGVELPVDEWLTGVARVREQARAWEQIAIQAGAFGLDEPQLTPLQLPYAPGDPWLALAFEPGTALDRDRLLYTACLPARFDPAARRCGLLLDEWTEVIPADRQETAIATHFDRPSSEPPQALLLVLPTGQTGGWIWDDVTGALDDTLRLARKRAVEPVHVDATPYARFLPATVSATTLRGVSIGLALARNNADVVKLAHRGIGDG